MKKKKKLMGLHLNVLFFKLILTENEHGILYKTCNAGDHRVSK